MTLLKSILLTLLNIRGLFWTLFVDYHIRRRDRYNGHKVLQQYHQEKARYYYKKAWKEDPLD